MAVTETEDTLDVAAPATTSAPERRGPVLIPTYRYTSPTFADMEMQRLWPRVWQLACSVDHVANPGDYFEHSLGPYSVMVVRGDDGVLRAFQNSCRHRANALCEGSGGGLTEIRCPFHRWTWDLAGRLREVPSRREFGVRNEDYPLIEAQVGEWGPLVFVNLALDAEPLDEFLEDLPSDCAWAAIEDFRCTAVVTIPVECNWKTVIEGFSETYHVQGLHREMLPMCDDVNGPEQLWRRHGKLQQSYGLPSPRLRDRPDDQGVWEGFIDVMGERVGISGKENAGPAPEVGPGETLRSVLAEIIRERGRASGIDFSAFDDGQMLDMSQYNLFPNITALVFSDLLAVVRSRPGPSHEDAFMDVYAFERGPAGDPSPRTKPIDVTIPADGELPLGVVLNQDVRNVARNQKGLRQPGLTHLAVSPTAECRVINLHRNLEEYLGIDPTELVGL